MKDLQARAEIMLISETLLASARAIETLQKNQKAVDEQLLRGIDVVANGIVRLSGAVSVLVDRVNEQRDRIAELESMSHDHINGDVLR